MRTLAITSTLLVVASLGAAAAESKPMRVCAAQPRSRLVDYKLKPADALAQADRNLGELEQIVDRAGKEGCDVLSLPEDTLGLLHWEMGNLPAIPDVLRTAVPRMLERLGRAAAAHRMYLICSSDTAEQDGSYRNTAFFLGRDGREIGRYYKVNLPLHESGSKRGDHFPVFKTDVDRAAFRTRAVDNFVYVVVAKRGGGAMIISPLGQILAEGKGADGIAIADINPFGGRAAGDALNSQADMRARLFRERNPAAYGILTDPHPPVLDRLPATISAEDAIRVGAKTLTVGNDRFSEAQALLKSGRTAEAKAAFEKLRAEFPYTWIDRASRAALEKMKAGPQP